MELYVIESTDGEDHETFVIGVASDMKNARRMIEEYYGKHKVIEERDIRDSGIELTMRVEWRDQENYIIDSIVVRDMILNDI